jgi:glycosyltransferase involved in cell wall biosynthesis
VQNGRHSFDRDLGTASCLGVIAYAHMDFKMNNACTHYEPEGMRVGVLTGCQDPHYVFGLVMALSSKGVHLDVVGSDVVDNPEFHKSVRLRFLNLRGSQRNVEAFVKALRLLRYYCRLMFYALSAEPSIFHILWNNRVEWFDRTLLMCYYKCLGKRIVFTAHNVNEGKRDGHDTLLNRITLRVQYWLADHIFVHTEKMKSELLEEFDVRGSAVTVIPYGINNAVPDTVMTLKGARQRLGIAIPEKTILFFGSIAPYKGLATLVTAFRDLVSEDSRYRLIIAGAPKNGSEGYLKSIQEIIDSTIDPGRVIQRIEFIPDDEAETYFKSADVLVLPYTQIFQSGILFMAFSFGLPVVAADVGSFKEDIIEGKTGFLCHPDDSADLARAIRRYFESELFANLSARRPEIREYAMARHSWDLVGEMTRNVYANLRE